MPQQVDKVAFENLLEPLVSTTLTIARADVAAACSPAQRDERPGRASARYDIYIYIHEEISGAKSTGCVTTLLLNRRIQKQATVSE